MTMYAEATARRSAITLLLIGALIPVALIAWQAALSLKAPIVQVPGALAPSEVQPNNVTTAYLTAFARGWLTRRFTANVYNFESVMVAAAEDCSQVYRIEFLNQAKGEHKRFLALEKSSSANVIETKVDALAPGVWKVSYRITIKAFYASIQVPDERIKGELILIQASSTAKHPVQVSGLFIAGDKSPQTEAKP